MSEVEHVAFEPKFKGPIEGYVRNQLKKHLWRVNRHRDYEDMMQEAYCVFYHLRNRYGAVEGMNAPWFMSLFTRSFTNMITNISLLDSRNSVEVSSGGCFDDEDTLMDVIMNAVGEQDNAAIFRIYLKQAPSEIRSIMSILFNTPEETLEVVSSVFRNRGDSYGNKMLCSMVGLDPKKWDLKFMLQEYIRPIISD